MARRLIITADDLGANPPRSHGIFLCAEHGLVTNAGLLPNGSDSQTAAKRARERKVPTGLHLALTSGEPLSPPDTVATLLMPNGSFCERKELEKRLHEGTLDIAHLEREIRAQMEWFLDAHGQPTHLSSVDHMHVHPAIVQVVAPILLRYGVLHVRIPEEPLPPFGYEVPAAELAPIAVVNARAAAARALFAGDGIASTDTFRGATLVGRASAKNLRHVLSRLPDEGTIELMVHPGSPTPIGLPFDTDPQRQTELQMLTDESAALLLTKLKLARISYLDL
jgi:predicted glycoside hydrolase/deacetylase ChbG (UPF0249 family)